MSTLKEQIESARKQVRKMKRAIPYIFPEYQRMKHAEHKLLEAKEELKAAKAAWDRVGEAR